MSKHCILKLVLCFELLIKNYIRVFNVKNGYFDNFTDFLKFQKFEKFFLTLKDLLVKSKTCQIIYQLDNLIEFAIGK